MHIGSNPYRADRLRLKLYKAVSLDIAQTIASMKAEDARAYGDLYARVAAMHLAQGAQIMARLLDSHDDFADLLESALAPFDQDAVTEQDMHSLSNQPVYKRLCPVG